MVVWMLTIPRDENHRYVKRGLLAIIEHNDSHEWVIGFETGKTGYKHYQVRIKVGLTFVALKQHFPDAHIEQANEVWDYEKKEGNFICSRDNDSIISCRFGSCRDNQRRILQHCNKQSDRGITVCVDRMGNSGKTWLGRHLYERGRAVIVPCTIRTTQGIIQYIASAYRGQQYIIVDIPRSSKWTAELYEAIECIKDGLVYDTRYQGKMMDIWGVKVLVFTNTTPKLDKLSNDRWDLIGRDGNPLT